MRLLPFVGMLITPTLFGCGQPAEHRPSPPVSATPVDEPDKTRRENHGEPLYDVRGTGSDYQNLKGKWVRRYGGYVVDIMNVDESGKWTLRT